MLKALMRFPGAHAGKDLSGGYRGAQQMAPALCQHQDSRWARHGDPRASQTVTDILAPCLPLVQLWARVHTCLVSLSNTSH